MKKEYFLTALFFLIVGAFFYLFYRIMVPFFTPIAWAGILVIVFYPGFKWLDSKFRWPGLASLISCVIIFLLIIGPTTYLLASLASEATDALQKVNAAYQDGRLKNYLSVNIPFIDAIKNKYPQLAEVDFESIVKDVVSIVTKAIGSQATTVIANISKNLFYFVLMLFAMFFFFRDGERVVAFLKRLTPLTPDQVELMYSHLRQVIEGTMYGGVVIALIQGTLGGILFLIMGISSPVFWGAVMAFLAFIPILGPFLVYIPAGIIVFLSGSPIKGILLIAIGTLIVSQIDNFLRPMLFSGKTQMHTLLLFFSIMGGLALFGLLGVVLGPFITAVFVSLLRVFEVRMHPEDFELEETLSQ
ncbi:MAG: AI-2E family transporter [Candidatus Zixiibacteriota bacterium]|nr:MAG: AI-2E family transporter [candidate division Zixibacteria bacterium]